MFARLALVQRCQLHYVEGRIMWSSGRGDPNLAATSDELSPLSQALKKANIRGVR
jgi:hypothetical protein